MNIKKEFLDAVLEGDREFVVITHKNCMDGIGVVLAANHFTKDAELKEPRIILRDYGKGDYGDIENCNVLIADYSFDRDTTLKIQELANKVIVLDHHKSAKEALDGLDFVFVDLDKSGCILTWEFLNRIEETPVILDFINDYDLYKFDLPDSREYNAVIQLNKSKDWKHTLDLQYDIVHKNKNFLDKGKALCEYQDITINSFKDKKTKDTLRRVLFFGHDVYCVNNTTLINEVGNVLAKDKPFSVQWRISEGYLRLYFRSDDNIDLTTLGLPKGHPNAAGWRCRIVDIDMNKFMRSYDLGVYLKSL